MKIVVSGGRSHSEPASLTSILHTLHGRFGIHHLAQGGGNDADEIAYWWAYRNKIECVTYPANWDVIPDGAHEDDIGYHKDGKPYYVRAGMMRNNRMIFSYRPDLVVASLGGKGTKHLLDISVTADIPTLREQAGGWEWANRPRPGVHTLTKLPTKTDRKAYEAVSLF